MRALILMLVLSVSAHASPYLPKSGSEVIEVLPQRASPLQRELRALRSSLARDPRNLELATALAEKYIAAGRSETDPRYYGNAQAALAPWWREAAPPASVRVLRATLMQATHRFDEAVGDLAAVTAAEPDNAQAWLTLATVQGVQGDFANAKASCAKLFTLADQAVSATCSAQVASLTGRLAASERLLANVYERGKPHGDDIDVWIGTVLGEMAARRGDFTTAEPRFRAALQTAPQDSYLLGAYADLLIDTGRYEDAGKLLAPYRRIDALLLRYARALKLAGANPGSLRAVTSDLDARFDAARRRGDRIHLREEAMYLLHIAGQAVAALDVAQQNWRVQKEPADARILLEAALAARNPAAARSVLEFIEANGLEDQALRTLAQRLGQGGRKPT